MRRAFALLATLLCFAQAAVAQFQMTPDPTGIWHDPSAPGWGAAVFQRGATQFVTLMVHDEERRPMWLVASDVRNIGSEHLDPVGIYVFRGPLYRVSGPWFGGPFDPAARDVRRVGELVMFYALNSQGRALFMRYDVGGRSVERTLERLTWASDAPVRMTPEPTSMWHDPAAPGWGAAIFQQGATMFVALMVHDEERRPMWLVASDVRNINGDHLDPGGYVFRGPVYRVSGPWFGGPFDPSARGVRQVGQLAMWWYELNIEGRVILMEYEVDGRRVSRRVERLTW